MDGRSEVAIIGAGFGGLAAAHELAAVGIDDIVIFERSGGVGGVWRANTYPGAACDIPSHLYSLSFAPNPRWSRAYASQPEILAYLEDCYDRFDVRRRVRLDTEIVAASWHDDDGEWVLLDGAGSQHRARFLVSATGMFHTASLPSIPGMGEFAGRAFHSSAWDHDQDLTGRRVAVVGTGASAIQIVPAIAERAAHLDVYQRTPPWIMPRKNPPFTAEQQDRFAEDPAEAALVRAQLFEQHEGATAFLADDPLLTAIESMARSYLERKVADDDLRQLLTPRTALGCTRTLISSDYYPAVQRDDVDLIVEPIDRILPSGIRTADGRERACDTIVWCTGFKAHDYLHGIEVRGRDGRSLHEVWSGVPRAFHGMVVPEFPNLFLLYGPNTNQGGNSIILILEAQARLVARSVERVRQAGAAGIEVRTDAMARYVDDLEDTLAGTVWATGCTTYFHTTDGAIVTQLPHSAGWYESTTDAIEWTDFELTPTRRRSMTILTGTEPAATHIGADDLPFVDLGGGNKLKVLQVREAEGLWIVESIFQAGYQVPPHRHTGPVFGYTVSGAWKYKEYDYVNRAGSFLHEPAGSVHTLQCIEDDTQVWFHMYGVNLNLDKEGAITSVSDGAGTLAMYYALCEAQGLPRPNVLVG